jgi:tRNA threonylcarbamoyladenosine biosynthesis protein TsaE
MLAHKKTTTYKTTSPEDTIGLGTRLAADLHKGDIVYLYGDLGSGKTVLVKGMCIGLGIDEEVTSSSFVIATEYKGNVCVSHIDLYRLDGDTLSAFPLNEYILSDGITFVEWAERLGNGLHDGIAIHIRIVGETQREFIIEDSRY